MNTSKPIFKLKKKLLVFIFLYSIVSCTKHITTSYLGKGWSNNSINVVKFRKNAITTFKNTQFTGYYNAEGYLVLGKRKLNTAPWETVVTPYKANVKDAHNSISLAVDGEGFLHVSWDHHDSKLRYAKSKVPFGLELETETSMTGLLEDKVTYPQFYNLLNGNLLFFYRSGASGRGNLVINSYDVKNKLWIQLNDNLIDGENQRSAYWQACVDAKGTIHVSWIWRETWDVETNHDMCYARSVDGGVTWEQSSGEKYKLPITLASAEYVYKIPQQSNLINQTSMVADVFGNPYIASYWNEQGITQYHIVYLQNKKWQKVNTGFRHSMFTLGGGGTKKIPISRPDLLIDNSKKEPMIGLLFRDEERANKVSFAYTDISNPLVWKVIDLSPESVGDWEPNYDIQLWNSKQQLHIFMQYVTQKDGEGVVNDKASNVSVLEVKNLNRLLNKSNK